MSEAISDQDILDMIARLDAVGEDAVVDVGDTHIPRGLAFGVHTVSGNRARLLRLAAAALQAAAGPNNLKQDALFREAKPLEAVLAEHSDRLLFARRDSLAGELVHRPTKVAKAMAAGTLGFVGVVLPVGGIALMLIGAVTLVRWIVRAIWG